MPLAREVRTAGMAAWPAIDVDEDRLVAYLAARPQATADPTDLYLACACELRVDHAIDTFVRVHLAAVELGTLARVVDVDEVRQLLAMRLVLGDSPRIRDYHGRGALAGWVRIAAVRIALDLARRTSRETADPEDVLVDLAVDGDPELELMKHRYADHFREGFREALKQTDAPARALLRLHYLEGMTTAALAALYRVSRPTIVRRIADARTHILETTATVVKDRLGLSTDAYSQLLAVVRGGLEITIERMMSEP